jgi:mRNA interferase RelE/StbE
MNYQLIFEKQVKKFIEKQDKSLKKRFKKAFLSLKENPYPTNQTLNIKKLKGSKEYRLRIGKYRFIYQIKEDVLIIVMEKADSRGDIYK